MSVSLQRIRAATQYIRKLFPGKLNAGLILGSGLGVMADSIKDPSYISYKDIPYFPIPSVQGHSGNLVIGQIGTTPVIAMQGRIHYYEHQDMVEVTFPLRVLIELGIEYVVITNACGGIRSDLYPGALMLIQDHINLMGANPLVGNNQDNLGPRFPDMSSPYCPHLIKSATDTAKNLAIDLFNGVYCAVSGPNYASRAELIMYRFAGADTIGMSTVPEVIVANHAGIPVLGISCITDMAIPESISPLSHKEVIEVAHQTKPTLAKFISAFIESHSI